MSPEQPSPKPTEEEKIKAVASIAKGLDGAVNEARMEAAHLPKVMDLNAIMTGALTGVMPFPENAVLDEQYELLCAKAGDLGFVVRREEGYTEKDLAISVRHVAAINDVHISLQHYTNHDASSDQPYLYLQVSQAEVALEVFSTHATFNALAEQFRSYPTFVDSEHDTEDILPTNYGACNFFGVSNLDYLATVNEPVETFGLYLHAKSAEEVMQKTLKVLEMMAEIILAINPMSQEELQPIVQHDTEKRVLREARSNAIYDGIKEVNDPNNYN